MAAGGTHSLALLADQTLVAWGQNNYGQLGNGTNMDSSVPVRVEGLNKVIAIAAGLSHSLALREDGTVWAWGHNTNGQLGDGTSASRNVASRVSELAGVTLIAAGANHNLALGRWPRQRRRCDGLGPQRHRPARRRQHHQPLHPGQDTGRLVRRRLTHRGRLPPQPCRDRPRQHPPRLGKNTSGQLGDGTTDQRNTPVSVPGLTGVQLVTGGREHTTALLGDNTVRSWGANSSGQLGNVTTTDSSTPVTTLTGLTGVDKIATAIGGDFSLAN
ncbi:RCC1 domain-containing protein [Streptomyces sp. NPDC055037]